MSCPLLLVADTIQSIIMADRGHVNCALGCSLKRKASTALVPDSMLSYMTGSLKNNFDHLKDHILKDCAFVAAKSDPKLYLKQLLEEAFRYLYLLAGNSSDGVVRSSPSYFVDQAFHCLMLDPVLYFQVCDEILALHGHDEVKVRVLPHDALGGQGTDTVPRKARYFDTLARYKQTFGQDPPLALWTDYSNDNVAVMAEFEAQQADFAATSRPHHAHTRNQASVPTAVADTAVPTLPAPSAPRSASKILAVSAAATKAASKASVAATSTVVSAVPARKTPDEKDTIKLRVEDKYGDHFDTTMALGEKFKSLIGAVAHRQGRKPKDIELRYKKLLLTGEMQPLSLNLTDGEVLVCSGSAVGPATRVNFSVAGHGSEQITSASKRLTLREMCDRFIERSTYHKATLGWTFTYKQQVLTDFTKTLLDIGHQDFESIVCTKIMPPEPVVLVAPVPAPVAAEEERVVVRLIDQNRGETVMRLKSSTRFKALFAAYAGEKKVDVSTLRFLHAGRRLDDTVSLRAAGIKDNDEIYVVLQLGGV